MNYIESIHILELFLIACSVFLVWRQIKKTHEWNRRNATRETLEKLFIGDFPELRDKLEKLCGCIVWRIEDTYDNVIENNKDKKNEIDNYLRRLLNIFETIAINIKNNVIDEDICYDNLNGIYVACFNWSKGFINKKRNESDDQFIYIELQNYALKWQNRSKLEKNGIGKKLSLPGKKKL